MSSDAREAARRIVDELVAERGDFRTERAAERAVPPAAIGPDRTGESALDAPVTAARAAARRIVAEVFDASPAVTARPQPAEPASATPSTAPPDPVVGSDAAAVARDSQPRPRSDDGTPAAAGQTVASPAFPDQLFAERPARGRSTADDVAVTRFDRDGSSQLTSEPTEVAARIVADVLAARGGSRAPDDETAVTEQLRASTRSGERDPDPAPAAASQAALAPEPDGPPPPPAEALAAAAADLRPVEDARLAAQPLEDEPTRSIDLDPPPRPGRWLLATVVAALALAVLFPLAIAALRQLAAMS